MARLTLLLMTALVAFAILLSYQISAQDEVVTTNLEERAKRRRLKAAANIASSSMTPPPRSPRRPPPSPQPPSPLRAPRPPPSPRPPVPPLPTGSNQGGFEGGAFSGSAFVPCYRDAEKNVFVDGDQFPFGDFNSDICSCDTSPFGFTIGGEMLYRNATYYTFRLYNKPCNRAILVPGTRTPVCNVTSTFLNKIAIRLENTTIPCFNRSSLPIVDTGIDVRGVFFLPDSQYPRGVAEVRAARVGTSRDKQHVELYLHGINKDSSAKYLGGTFLIPKCAQVGSFSNYCKHSADGKCIFSFVDTPGHRFLSMCKATFPAQVNSIKSGR